VLPVRHELHVYILFGSNSDFKELTTKTMELIDFLSTFFAVFIIRHHSLPDVKACCGIISFPLRDCFCFMTKGNSSRAVNFISLLIDLYEWRHKLTRVET
jgi:hypothetical protein